MSIIPPNLPSDEYGKFQFALTQNGKNWFNATSRAKAKANSSIRVGDFCRLDCIPSDGRPGDALNRHETWAPSPRSQGYGNHEEDDKEDHHQAFAQEDSG